MSKTRTNTLSTPTHETELRHWLDHVMRPLNSNDAIRPHGDWIRVENGRNRFEILLKFFFFTIKYIRDELSQLHK